MFFSGIGVIGNKGMKPTMTITKNDRGEEERFIRFNMFCDNLNRPAVTNDKTGYKERPKQTIQVILPDNKRGRALFEMLSPGRKVFVTGTQHSDPAEGRDNHGNKVLYANTKVMMTDLQFCDADDAHKISQVMRIAKEAGVSQDVIAAMQNSISVYLANQVEEQGPPRIIIDKTKTETSNESPNPDKPDFLS